jgi:hypothetical protein
MIDWNQWFEDVIEKAEQLSLFGPKLTVKVEGKKPEEMEIEPRAEGELTRPRPAAPKRRLTVPPKGPKPPPGGGWRRTPNGWAQGQGDSYKWEPLNWAEKRAVKPQRTPEHEKKLEIQRFQRQMEDAGWHFMSSGPGYATFQTFDRSQNLRIDKVGEGDWVLVSGERGAAPLGRFESMSAARPSIISAMRGELRETAPTYVELTKEERKAIFDFAKWGQVNIEVAKYQRLVDEGYLEVLERGEEGRPHFGPGNAMVVVSDKGREWIRQDRAKRIKEEVRQGKLAHEEVGWALFAANDAYNQAQQAERRGGDREAKQAVFERAVDHLYEVEKKHGAIPTTARGVREALGVPEEWSIPERTATGPARMIVISAGDTIMKVNWTKEGPVAYRQWWNHTRGGFWQNVDKKKKPARELIAKEIEKRSELKRRAEEDYAARDREELEQAEQDPVVRGPELEVETANLEPGKLNAQQFSAGVEWAERVMSEKTETPHHDTERMFRLGMAGEADVSNYIPTPRQLAALDSLALIADRKLWVGTGLGRGERKRHPDLTKRKEAFWRGVQAFARQGQDQWRGDGETGPFADYILEFRSYVKRKAIIKSGPFIGPRGGKWAEEEWGNR